MNNIPILSRQQRREAERKGVAMIKVAQLSPVFDELHYRLNVAFECMRMLGLTEEQLVEAQESIKARLKILGKEAN